MATQTHDPYAIGPESVQLDGISELVFLDRYAVKDTGKELAVGDTVVVLVKEDPRFPQKEVGTVHALDGDTVTIRLKSTGELFTQERKKVDRPIELTPAQMWDRMANAIVAVEEESRRQELRRQFRWLLDGFRFSPGGRINTMLGTGQHLTAYNCYVIPLKANNPANGNDSRQAIIDTLGNMVEIMSRGGGVGINLSTLRPRLSHVSGVSGRSSGSVSWGGLFSFATGLVEQGGCFSGHQRIATTKGLIPAAELADRIDRGEYFEALTHDGPRMITARFRNGIKEVYEVTTSRGFSVQVTAAHKMGVLLDGRITTVPLETLQPGDEILILLGSGVEADYVKLSPIVDDSAATQGNAVQFPHALDERVAYDLGFLFGGGDAEHLSGPLANLAARADLLGAWLAHNNLMSSHDSNGRVPESLFRSPGSVVAAFIDGLTRAGSDDGSQAIDSASLGLLQDVQQLLAANGVLADIQVIGPSGGNHPTTYRLTVHDTDFKVRLSAMRPWPGQRTTVRRSTTHNGTLKAARRALTTEPLTPTTQVVPDAIVSITPLGPTAVYDFEVLGVHMLAGNGLYTSNSRRGALMLILDDWHPDLLDFIKAKRDMGAITNANISVGVSDAFMKAIEDDLEWEFVFPDTTDPDYDTIWDGNIRRWRNELGKPVKVYKRMRAREIWDTVIESAWLSAEPGVVFLERMNEYSNAYYFEDLIATNPCGEQPLPGWGVCNLGHLNLARFTRGPIGQAEVLWDDLRRATRLGVRFLDNIIDITPYFFPENERVQKAERRVGMGTLGLGEMLIRLGLRYGSPESLAFIDKLYEFIATEAYLSSVELAEEKGAFPKFDAEKFVKSGFMRRMPEAVRQAVRERGIRNVCILTQAPTGSTGTMIGTSTGIEPYYSWTYWRNSRLGMREVHERIVHEYFDQQQVPAEQRDVTKLPPYFVTAMQLSPKEHVQVQAAIQRWTDSSISKTANTPNHYTIQQTKELYEYAYKLGCKGVTTYRDGSRDQQVLIEKKAETEPEKEKAAIGATAGALPLAGSAEQVASAAEHLGVQQTNGTGSAGAVEKSLPARVRLRKRPQKLTGATYEWPTPLGKAFITVNDVNGDPFEVFVNIGKAGSDVAAASEALGRLTTLFLKYGDAPAEEKVALLVKHLSHIGGSTSVGFGENRVTSVPDAMAKALKRHFEENRNGTKVTVTMRGHDLCPACGVAALAREEGCFICKSCGYTKC